MKLLPYYPNIKNNKNNRKEFIMENKKFKLTKESLDLVSLIQQMVFINISSYKSINDGNFYDDNVRNNFNNICNNYLLLHQSLSLNNWINNDYELKEKINKYSIQMNENITYHIMIDLTKEFNNSLKLSIQMGNNISDFIITNIFNIHYEV